MGRLLMWFSVWRPNNTVFKTEINFAGWFFGTREEAEKLVNKLNEGVIYELDKWFIRAYISKT